MGDEKQNGGATITITNLVSHGTRQGVVAIHHDGKQIGQMDPKTARQLAEQIHECAAVAETEAMLVGFLMEQIGLTLEQVTTVLGEFRRRRAQT